MERGIGGRRGGEESEIMDHFTTSNPFLYEAIMIGSEGWRREGER